MYLGLGNVDFGQLDHNTGQGGPSINLQRRELSGSHQGSPEASDLEEVLQDWPCFLALLPMKKQSEGGALDLLGGQDQPGAPARLLPGR